MTLNISAPTTPAELKPRIIVFGVGGAGCNAVNNMLRANIEGVECVVANTDSQALQLSLCERRIQLGMNITQGLGAGSRPEIGRAAAEEGIEDITAQIQGAHMVFITAGMGGGTGTGSAPVLARTAREHGLLTVGVVTKPFHFEGAHRMRVAEAGIEELQDVVDTLIVIPNQNLFRVANEKTTFADAFAMADEVLHSGVRGITDLMVMPGLINLDFADIRTVMTEMGKAMMGAGEADGDNRAIDAAEAAISNPLLDEVSMAGARGLLINITGGSDLTLYEVDEAANRIRDEVDPGANIIFGSTFDDSLNGRMRVSVFATGIEQPAGAARPRDVEVPMMAPRAPAPKPAVHDEVDVGAVQPAEDEPEEEPAAQPPYLEDQPEELPQVAARRDTEAPAAEMPEAGRRTTDEPEMDIPEMPAPRPAEAPPAAAAAQVDMFGTMRRDAPETPSNDTLVVGEAAAESGPAAPRVEPAEEPHKPKKEPLFSLRRFLRSEDDDAEEEAPVRREPTARPRQPAAPAMSAPAAQPAPAAQAGPAVRREAVAADEAGDPNRARTVRLAERPGRRPDVTVTQPSPRTESNDEDDLLEIPAFLRRQAN